MTNIIENMGQSELRTEEKIEGINSGNDLIEGNPRPQSTMSRRAFLKLMGELSVGALIFGAFAYWETIGNWLGKLFAPHQTSKNEEPLTVPKPEYGPAISLFGPGMTLEALRRLIKTGAIRIGFPYTLLDREHILGLPSENCLGIDEKDGSLEMVIQPPLGPEEWQKYLASLNNPDLKKAAEEAIAAGLPVSEKIPVLYIPLTGPLREISFKFSLPDVVGIFRRDKTGTARLPRAILAGWSIMSRRSVEEKAKEMGLADDETENLLRLLGTIDSEVDAIELSMGEGKNRVPKEYGPLEPEAGISVMTGGKKNVEEVGRQDDYLHTRIDNIKVSFIPLWSDEKDPKIPKELEEYLFTKAFNGKLDDFNEVRLVYGQPEFDEKVGAYFGPICHYINGKLIDLGPNQRACVGFKTSKGPMFITDLILSFGMRPGEEADGLPAKWNIWDLEIYTWK